MSTPTEASVQAVATAFPGPAIDQERLLADLELAWAGQDVDRARLERLHRATQVRSRHFALPMDRQRSLRGLGARNRAWQEAAASLGERALVDALARANLAPRDLDHLFLVTNSGIALPGLDVRIANRLRMKDDLVRWPLTGFGCLGGGAGLVRAAQLLDQARDRIAAVVAVELFSYTLQLDDLSGANLVATGLFGDGAAAAVVCGAWRTRPGGPRLVATRSVLFPDTEWAMGWDLRDSGFGVVLSEKVPALALAHVRGPVDSFLAAQGLRRHQVRHWICHPGGPKVLRSIAEALELPPAALWASRQSLAEVGNLSSASILHVLKKVLDEPGGARAGDWGLALALGPGFAAELALLRW